MKKRVFHQTSIQDCLFRVPGIKKRERERDRKRDFGGFGQISPFPVVFFVFIGPVDAPGSMRSLIPLLAL